MRSDISSSAPSRSASPLPSRSPSPLGSVPGRGAFRRHLPAMACAALAGLAGVLGSAGGATAAPVLAPASAPARVPASAPAPVPASAAGRLVNLAHLDSLTTRVRPPAQAGHETYPQAADRGIGVLWVYANRLPGGGYQPTGGGTYDPATNTYGQGSFDADDISRASVVYLRHWRRYGDRHSRDQAFQLLRGLTYLQTSTGPHAGDVVLWMQPDGTLNPSATPKDDPDPSDSGPSYWLARTIWALGEGYAAFRGTDPGFASFLRARLDLAVGALDREVLGRYGQYQIVHGVRVPAWLIVDGADATSEAMLGLSAYVAAGGTRAARTALGRFADGVAAMNPLWSPTTPILPSPAPAKNARNGNCQTPPLALNSGVPLRIVGEKGCGLDRAHMGGAPDRGSLTGSAVARIWPYGAVLPWALSRSDWHAWAAQMTSALARAAVVLGRPGLLAPAVTDAAVFTPHLLTATGPDNGWLPTPADGSQIAYGADARVEGLLAAGQAEHSGGLRELAGVAAGWFFGQNPAGVAMYDPSTGVTFDGVSPSGVVNDNSGAESTIHGLLTMQALDAAPDLAALARTAGHVVHRDGQRSIEAEAATLTGGARVVTPPSPWTGESQWSGGAYVSAPSGGRLTWALPATTQPSLVEPVVDLVQGSTARAAFTTAARPLGRIDFGTVGAQGVAPAPGELRPVPLLRNLPAGATGLTADISGGTGALDAVLLTPLISQLVTGSGAHAVALLSSVARTERSLTIAVPGSGPIRITSYDTTGHLWKETTATGAAATVPLAPGGFALVIR